MGITARGAWVAVQRHFRELNVDVQTDPVTVVGVGDMSGDVFGNGLLRSRAVRLVAAFDHRDIFIDPEPDPEAAYDERRRLYDLPRSSWQDYNRDLMSAGGGVWSRTLKEIPLSEQARAALRIEEQQLTPPELIRALLKAPVDLLFNGGIGTYVKASGETNADVGDRANDAVRVNGDELGARVVGEGGNLALTQRGRIQYARRGGRLNTDAIDNSAGVDTSDREVNLKILLAMAVDRGLLDADERNAFLAAMTDEVAALVLRDVYLQTWAISQELAQAPGGMEAYEAFMLELESAGRLDREVEVLPSSPEMERRQEAGAGLTRPELAVLLAYSKVDLLARLLDSELPDDPFLVAAERAYFPPLAAERFGDLLPAHRLRRELIATVVANDIVNRMGITYVSRTANEYGAMAWEVAAAYWVAVGVADADAYWRAIEALDGDTDPAVQLAMKADLDALVDAFTRAYLRQGVTPATMADAVRSDRPVYEQLDKAMTSSGAGVRPASVDQRVRHYSDLGIDPELAERLGALEDLMAVPDIAEAVRATGESVERVAAVFFRLSEELPMNRLYDRVGRIRTEGHWERWQQRGLVDDLRELRRSAAARALVDYPELPAGETVDRFLADRASARERVTVVTRLFDRETDAGLPAVAVAVRALREAL
jgi:glutamate dehydrogenase